MIHQMIFYYHTIKARKKAQSIRKIGIDKYYSEVHDYANGNVLPVEMYHRQISELIESGTPMMIARFGSTELLAMSVFDYKIVWKYTDILKQMQECAGFFPCTKESARTFSKEMHKAMPLVDMMAIWNLDMEENYIKKYMHMGMSMARLRYLEPWYSDIPWTKSLKGKKVLIIHPFEHSIREQYKKRELLFANPDILPEFELRTLKAVQTIAGQKDKRFETWFDALDYMEKEAMRIDFDIALIGCGAYGFPLAARLKKAGKQAIHMGGVLQILFGIKGKRWDNDSVVEKLYNEYWIRPYDLDRPQNAKIVEGGCYW